MRRGLLQSFSRILNVYSRSGPRLLYLSFHSEALTLIKKGIEVKATKKNTIVVNENDNEPEVLIGSFTAW